MPNSFPCPNTNSFPNEIFVPNTVYVTFSTQNSRLFVHLSSWIKLKSWINFMYRLLNISLSFLRWFTTLTPQQRTHPSPWGNETIFCYILHRAATLQALFVFSGYQFYTLLGTVRRGAKVTCPTSLPAWLTDKFEITSWPDFRHSIN